MLNYHCYCYYYYYYYYYYCYYYYLFVTCKNTFVGHPLITFHTGVAKQGRMQQLGQEI